MIRFNVNLHLSREQYLSKSLMMEFYTSNGVIWEAGAFGSLAKVVLKQGNTPESSGNNFFFSGTLTGKPLLQRFCSRRIGVDLLQNLPLGNCGVHPSSEPSLVVINCCGCWFCEDNKADSNWSLQRAICLQVFLHFSPPSTGPCVSSHLPFPFFYGDEEVTRIWALIYWSVKWGW